MLNTKVINKNIIIVLFFVIFSISNISYATEESKENITKAYRDITDSLDYIKQNISYVNTRISHMKKTDAYDVYPAVRLNVETPLFGINSIINNKLEIKENVATTDIISGYSVYDIIRTNTVKVPSLSVGTVVVSTRDIKLDENMTMSDLNTSLNMLLISMNKSKEVRDFIDEYVNKNFNEYIEKEKIDRINNNNLKCDELEKNLLDIEKDLITLRFINNDKHNEYLEKFNKIYGKIFNIKSLNKNVLITDKNLKDNENSVINIEKEIVEMAKNIKNDIENSNTDLEFVIGNILEESILILNNTESYLDNSYQKFSIEEIKEKNNTDITDGLSYDNNNFYFVYSVTSENSIDIMKDIIKQEIELLYKFEDSNKNYAYNTNEYNEILNSFIYSYKALLKEESNFYNSNYDILIKYISEKSATIVEYTDEYISSDYFYSNFYAPNELNEILEKYNTKDSYLNNVNIIYYLKQNLSTAKDKFKQVSTLYNNLVKTGTIS